ncbi:MAG: hypothetical protein MZV70_21355 [Desulfobacterales bacterium]|nr:hypothetical protein [Desulfobacterales bacterium]
MARMITGRPKVLVFNYCYHGSVDETFIVARRGRHAHLPRRTTWVRRLTRARPPRSSSSTTSPRSKPPSPPATLPPSSPSL